MEGNKALHKGRQTGLFAEGDHGARGSDVVNIGQFPLARSC